MALPPLVTGFVLGPTVGFIERHVGWPAAERALRAAELPVEAIEDQRLFIPYAAEGAVIEHAARSVGEANLALYIAQKFPFSDLGVYGRYTAMAPDLATAFARAVRGLRYATNSGRFGMHVCGDNIRITFHSGIQGALGARHVHGGTLLMLVDLIRHFAGKNWNPIRFELDQPRDVDAQNVEQLFGAPVVFNCPQPALVLEPWLLGRPNLRSPLTREQLTFGDLRQMVRSKPHSNLRSTVVAVLRLRLLEGLTDLEGTAQILGIGPRTLQRRLQSEGLSYGDLVEIVRLDRAIGLLTDTSERVADVAASLGYSAAGHFIRAFRRWTGRTPAAFRKSHS